MDVEIFASMFDISRPHKKMVFYRVRTARERECSYVQLGFVEVSEFLEVPVVFREVGLVVALHEQHPLLNGIDDLLLIEVPTRN